MKTQQMKKRWVVLLLSFFMGVSTAWAHDFSATCSSGQTLYYTITDSNNHYVSVVAPGGNNSSGWNNYTKPTGAMEIPATVVSGSVTYTVTIIENYAFYGCSGLTSVTIPNTVTTIGDSAFVECTSLNSFNIPSSVTEIGSDPFWHTAWENNQPEGIVLYKDNCCLGFTWPRPSGDLNFAQGTRLICSEAFYGNYGLTSVTIPGSVTSIGGSAFENCTGLTSVTLGEGVTSINSLSFAACTGLISVNIPNTVTSIGNGAFYGCSELTEVTISNSVTSIEESTFYGCSGLTSVTIPNSVTSIGSEAFQGCSSLTSVTIPNSVTSIGSYAFYGCSGLTSVTIGNSVTFIGPDAFSGCSGLTSVTIGNSVTYIGDYAFSGCNGLTSFNIPSSVTEIGFRAFYETGWCNSQSDGILYKDGCLIGYKGSAPTGAFSIDDGTRIIAGGALAGCPNLTSVTIPNSVTAICRSAFLEDTALAEVSMGSGVTLIGKTAFSSTALTTFTVPNSVIRIRDNAFFHCTQLESVTIGNSVVSLGEKLFSSCYALNTITVLAETPPAVIYNHEQQGLGVSSSNVLIEIPCGTLSAYQNAPVWRYYNLSDPNREITATVSPAESGTVSGAGNHCLGETCTLVATAAAGYTFANWTKAGIIVSTNANYSFEVTEAGDYTANFVPANYTITATANPANGGTVSGAGTYSHGASCTLTATPANGYAFVQWTENGTAVSTSPTYTFEVTGARNLTAVFEQSNHWSPIGGTLYNMTVNGYITINGVEQTVTTLEVGAFCGNECRGSFCAAFFPPTQQYIVSHTIVSNEQSGETITFRLFDQATGQELTNLQCMNDVEFEADATIGTIGDWFVFAFGQQVTIAATANPTSGGTVSGAGDYAIGANCTLTATPSEGYTFTNWKKGNTVVSTSANYTFTVTEAASYTATFTLNSYAITATANPTTGGTVTGAGTYNHGASCTLTATPAEGYTFTNWKKGNTVVSTSANYTFTVTEAASYTATFTLNSYTITATANPTVGGTVSGAGTYNHGASCTLTATSAEGYTFTNWKKGNTVVSTSATYTFNVTEAASYTATFTLNSYTITATANPTVGGTVSGAGTYNHGASCTLTATPATGYTFTNWKKGNTVVSTSTNYTFTVTEAASYTATFTLNSYAITATANPTSGGTVSGAGTYNHGDQVTLTATANEGYTFVDWTENGVAVTTDASYSFMAIGDRDLVANFSEMTFTNHWTTITGTQFNMTMSGLIYIDGAVQASTALEIGAFCGDECRGSARAQFFPPTGEYVVSLTVVSNLQSGENITFRLYDHVTQQEFPTECVNSITFVANSSHGEMGNWYPYAFNNAVAITAVVTPEGAGVVEGFGDYLPGTSCTLTATANTGYAFRSWSVAGEVVSTDNPYTFTVSGGVEVTANFDSQETTALTEGWTWWSTSIELSGIDGLTMLEESLGHNGLVIKAANKFVQNYYPSLGYDYWFGQLGSDDFTNASSYMIQTTADCEVTMTGTYADPSDHPIQLYPNWTWIGYPCGVQQSATSAFTGFIPTANDKVKGQYAFSTYYDNYGWFPEFTMTPGQGYMYQSNASDTRTLTFANGSKADPMPANQENLYWRSNVHAYADNMNVIAVVTIEGEEQGGEGLELGAFVNGECRGSVFLKHFPPTDRWYAMLTVTGMDGDKVEFGIMDRGRGMASMTSDKSLFFQSNAVIGELDEPCTINFSTMGCAENNLESPMHIYPNPIRRNETFRILVPLGEKVAEMTIVNTLGTVICHKVGAIDSLEMEGLPVAGVYMVRVVSDSGNVYYGKLIVR